MPGGLTPDFQHEVYAPTQVHHGQILNVFLPDRPMPPGGYPCVLFVNNSGFTDTAIHASIDGSVTQGHLYLLMRQGFAIASMKTTVKNNTTTGGGSTVIGGRGCLLPVSNSASKNVLTAWTSNAFLEKDACLGVQFLRRNAARFGLSGFVIVDGRSGGAQGALAPTLWPDMNGVSGFWGGASSRPDGCIVRALSGIWWLGIQTGGSYDAAAAAHHYSDASTDLLTSADTTVATTLTDALTGQKTQSSPLRIGFDPGLTWHDSVATTRQALIRQTNAKTRICIYTSDSTLGAANIDDGSETTHTTAGYISGSLATLHDPWNAYALREALAEIGVEFGDSGAKSRLMVSAAMDTYAQANATTTSSFAVAVAADVLVEDDDGDVADDAEIEIALWATALYNEAAPQPISASVTAALLDEVLGR